MVEIKPDEPRTKRLRSYTWIDMAEDVYELGMCTVDVAIGKVRDKVEHCAGNFFSRIIGGVLENDEPQGIEEGQAKK